MAILLESEAHARYLGLVSQFLSTAGCDLVFGHRNPAQWACRRLECLELCACTRLSSLFVSLLLAVLPLSELHLNRCWKLNDVEAFQPILHARLSTQWGVRPVSTS